MEPPYVPPVEPSRPPAYPTPSDVPADVPAGEPGAQVPQGEPGSQVPERLPQFGGVASPATEAHPAINEQGGYVSARPLLTTGAYGPVVAELAKLLHGHGFPNRVHAGLVEPVLDDGLMLLVRAFQAERGLDPAGPQGGAAPLIPRSHAGIVDARTWEELLGGVEEGVLAVADRYPYAGAAA